MNSVVILGMSVSLADVLFAVFFSFVHCFVIFVIASSRLDD